MQKQVICVRMTKEMIETINKIVKKQQKSSRSEFLRQIIVEHIDKTKKTLKTKNKRDKQ
jgi:metal-responsive CopG/Arc/MetJ family transcriptional regulator